MAVGPAGTRQVPFLWELGLRRRAVRLPCSSSSSVRAGQRGSRALGAGFVLLTGSRCAMMIYVSAGSLLFMITRCADRIYLVQEFAC